MLPGPGNSARSNLGNVLLEPGNSGHGDSPAVTCDNHVIKVDMFLVMVIVSVS